MFVYRLAAIFLLIFSWSGVAAGAQVSGSVSNNSGTALAHITVTLTDDQTTASLIQRTDAFGRYQFSSVSSGTYQVAFADENFINFIDEDPFPDEGTIHLDAMLPQTITVQENQNLDLGDFALARVDSTDNRQSNATVTNCSSFGDSQTPQTLAYALANAQQVAITCAGSIAVPELTITQDVSITATTEVAFEAAGFNRIFRVLPGVTLQVSGIDITNGDFRDGGGIALQNMGTTTIEDAEITGHSGNSATIQNRGTLTLRNVRQSLNQILFDSVLMNTGVITGTDVTIERHTATGGPVITNRGRIELRRCQISGLRTNNVWSVNNEQDSTMQLFDCTFTQSSSPFSNQGTLEIFDSSIDENSGNQSVIENRGVLRLGGTGVTNNNVSGAIVNNQGLAEIINSTISGNSGGFSLLNEDNAGVISNSGLMRVTTSTIANNTRLIEEDRQIGNSGEFILSNTIISGVEGGIECGGVTPVQSIGHNLQTDGTCGTLQQTDIAFGNPGLLELASNGGLGRTHALQFGSDAIDAGNCGDGATAIDQRGVSRTQGSNCDIGAYELIAAAPEPQSDPEPQPAPQPQPAPEPQPAPQPQPAPEPQPAPQPQPAPLPNDDTQDTDAGENPVTDDNVNSNTTDETDTESDTTPILSNDFTPGSGGGGGAVGFNLILLALLMLLSTRKRRYDRSF